MSRHSDDCDDCIKLHVASNSSGTLVTAQRNFVFCSDIRGDTFGEGTNCFPTLLDCWARCESHSQCRVTGSDCDVHASSALIGMIVGILCCLGYLVACSIGLAFACRYRQNQQRYQQGQLIPVPGATYPETGYPQAGYAPMFVPGTVVAPGTGAYQPPPQPGAYPPGTGYPPPPPGYPSPNSQQPTNANPTMQTHPPGQPVGPPAAPYGPAAGASGYADNNTSGTVQQRAQNSAEDDGPSEIEMIDVMDANANNERLRHDAGSESKLKF